VRSASRSKFSRKLRAFTVNSLGWPSAANSEVPSVSEKPFQSASKHTATWSPLSMRAMAKG
jgi:hypothetical protein